MQQTKNRELALSKHTGPVVSLSVLVCCTYLLVLTAGIKSMLKPSTEHGYGVELYDVPGPGCLTIGYASGYASPNRGTSQPYMNWTR